MNWEIEQGRVELAYPTLLDLRPQLEDSKAGWMTHLKGYSLVLYLVVDAGYGLEA